MVKRYKPTSSSVSGPRSLAGSENGSCSRRDFSKDKDEDQTFCVVLHVVEAINFCGRDGEHEQIVMNAALNTVDFEIEGQPSATAETIIFNSNCIWECDMAGIKRIKTDHRPVKVTFYSCTSQSERKTIGTLLLPIRGLPVLTTAGNQTALQLKMFWHKLICISNEFRSHKPEVLLMLAIVKKSLLHTQDFEHLMQFANPKSPPTPPLQSPGHSITANMLHSQANVYVQSLVQLGLLQVGNDPLIDCDIIEVVLQLKQLKNVCKLVKSLNLGKDVNTVLLVFDFVGNVTNIELKLNEKDSYILNDVLGLRFKSSLRSMRLYFQRIFYLPINMYINGTAIANYRMDFGKLMPEDSYFDENRKYVFSGSFTFNRLGRDSARDLKPLIEYTFSVDVKSVCSRQSQQGRIEDEVEPSLASGCSVIRQLPEQHKDSEAGSVAWQQDNTSSASLSVGAELSASDNDVGPDLDSPLDVDNNDDDPPKDLPRHQGRRKKFTRLTGHQESQDSDEDVCLVKKFSSMVVRQPLEHDHKVLAEQEDYPEPLSSDFDEEVLAQYKKFNKDKPAIDSNLDEIKASRKQRQSLKGRESSVKFDEEKPLQKNENDIRRNGKKEVNKEQITKANMKPIKKIKPSDSLELHKGNVAREELQNELESFKESNRVKKIKSAESYNNNLSKEDKLNKLKKIKSQCDNFVLPNNDQVSNREPNETKKPKSNPKGKLIATQSEDKLQRRARKLEEINAADLQQLPLMESILGKKERMQNRHQKLNICENGQIVEGRARNKVIQKVSKPERDEEEETESENSFSHSNSRCGGRCSRDEAYMKSIESNTDFYSREVFTELRRNKCKGQNPLVLDSCDPNLDDPKHLNVIENESQRKLKPKSKPINDNLNLPIGSVKEIKRIPRTPKSETTLSARWVEVNNKHQEKILKETENYKEQIFKTDEQCIKVTKLRSISNNESNIEDNSISPTNIPIKRTPKKQIMLKEEQDLELSYQFENSEEFLALKVIDSQSTLTNYLTNSELVESEMLGKKPTKRIARKKVVRKSEMEIEEPNTSLEIADCLNEDPIEPIKKKLIRKIPRKRIETDQTNDTEKDDSIEVLREDRPKRIIKKKSSELTDRQGDQNLETLCDRPNFSNDMANWKRQHMEHIEQEMQPKMDNIQLEQLQQAEVLGESHCDSIYESKFINLEEHVAKLKLEMEEQVDYFHQRSQEMSNENTQLRLEKSQLEKHISRMENEMKKLRQNKPGPDVGQEVKQVLNELAKQNKRFTDMVREKDRYKRQCRRSAKKIHSLKMLMYEKNISFDHGRNNTETGLNLKSIITKDAVEFEREYGQFRHPRSVPSFQISSESEELSLLTSRQTFSAESSPQR